MATERLKLAGVKLDKEDRELAAKLQKQFKTTFSEVMRRALRHYARVAEQEKVA